MGECGHQGETGAPNYYKIFYVTAASKIQSTKLNDRMATYVVSKKMVHISKFHPSDSRGGFTQSMRLNQRFCTANVNARHSDTHTHRAINFPDLSY